MNISTENNGHINGQTNDINTQKNYINTKIIKKRKREEIFSNDGNYSNIKHRQIQTANKIIALEEIFNDDDLPTANNLIQQLKEYQNGVEQDSINVLSIFLQLWNLAKNEYKELFTETKDPKGYVLSIAGKLEIILPANLAIADTDIERLSEYAITMINNITKDNKDDISFNLVTLLMLIEKRLTDGHPIPTDDKSKFNLLFSQGYFLYALVKNDCKDAFDYLINSKKMCKDVNIELQELPSWLIKNNDNIKSKHILAESVFINNYYTTKLLEHGANITSEIIQDAIPDEFIAFNKNSGWNDQSFRVDPDNSRIVATFSLLSHMSNDMLTKLPPHVINHLLGNNFICDITNTVNPSILNYINDHLEGEQKEQAIIMTLKVIKSADFKKTALYDVAIINILQNDFLFKPENVGLLNDNIIQALLCIFNKEPLNKYLISNEALDHIITLLTNNLNLVENKEYYCETYNAAFIQVILSALNSTNPQLAEKAQVLYEKYLQLPKIIRLLNNAEFKICFGDMDGKVAWDKESFDYILLSEDLVLLLSESQLEKFLDTTNKYPLIKWNEIMLFNHSGDNLPLSIHGLKDTYLGSFIIFKKNFLKSKVQGTISHIQSLNLDEYETIFINAIIEGTSKVKLTSRKDDVKNADYYLQQKLEKYINTDTENNYQVNRITEKHLADIKANFNLQSASNTEVAQCLMCLAYIFVKCSSNHVFGTENESLSSLRLYASALLKHAYDLDKSVFSATEENPEENQEENISKCYQDWQKDLMGDSCTAILSYIILNKILDNIPEPMISRIIPPCWL